MQTEIDFQDCPTSPETVNFSSLEQIHTWNSSDCFISAISKNPVAIAIKIKSI